MKFTKQQKKDYFNYLQLFQRGLLTEKIFNDLISKLEEKQLKINQINNNLCSKCNKKFKPSNVDTLLYKKLYCSKCYQEYKEEQEIKIFKFRNNIE